MARSGRAGVLERALEACLTGEVDALPELFTDDVSGWSPNMLVTSRGELAEVVAERDDEPLERVARGSTPSTSSGTRATPSSG